MGWLAWGGSGAEYELVMTEVVSAPITMTIETSGTVEPLSTVQVGCEVTGKIIDMAVDDDEPVSKGQVIARIDPELAEAQHRQALADRIKSQSALASARLSVEEQTANLPVLTKQALARKQEAAAAVTEAVFHWERTDKLYKKQDASEAEWILRKTIWERAEAALTATDAACEMAKNNEVFVLKGAREAVAQAEATLELSQAREKFASTRMSRCTILSPIDGIVLKRYQDVGTTVVAAFQPPLLFLLAPSLERMRVSAKVSESDIYHIFVGQPAQFTVEARQAISFVGRIMHKHNQPDIVQNVVTYSVDFEVDNDKKGTLIPGLSVNVEIECVSKESVALVSNAALRFKPPISLEAQRSAKEAVAWPEMPLVDSSGEETVYRSRAYAWQYDESLGQWRVTPLWVGVTDNINTEILSGAKPGDTFVSKFIDRSSSGFSFKEALRLASPDNRTL